MTLMYWREYRTQLHIGQTYGVSEATVSRTVRATEGILIRCGQFALPGKKALTRSGLALEVAVVDATECPVQRPKKTAAALQWQEEGPHPEGPAGRGPDESADHGDRLLHGAGRTTSSSSPGAGRPCPRRPSAWATAATRASRPTTRTAGRRRRRASAARSRMSRGQRTGNWHGGGLWPSMLFRSLKVFRILSERYRNRRKRFGLRFNLIAGLYNFELAP